MKANSVIVTVRYPTGGAFGEADFELPYDVPVGPLSVEFINYLFENELAPFSNNYYYFYNGQRRLNTEKTLRENQIYDGCFLILGV